MGKALPIAIIVAIIILVAGWYLIAPAFNTVEADDPAPQLVIRDSMLTMTAEEKAEFEEAVDAMSDEVMEMSDTMTEGALLLAQGNFRPRAHDVAGQALLIEENGKKILRFENFDTINGPNLHIYLSSNLGDDDFIDLGRIKATKGNVNYEIPDNIDTDRYNKVLVWCVPFRVLFSYAELQ